MSPQDAETMWTVIGLVVFICVVAALPVFVIAAAVSKEDPPSRRGGGMQE